MPNRDFQSLILSCRCQEQHKVRVGPFDARAAYVSYDTHELDRSHPYVFRTAHYRKTWTPIATGRPITTPVHQ
jgi:hypothetical protein